MDQMPRLCIRLVLPGALALQPGATMAKAQPDPIPLFAACTGRLSAQMEFQWLTQAPNADETQRMRDGMAEVLAALTPMGDDAQAMALRVNAKEAQRQILMLTLQTRNPTRAEWAKRRAAALLSECQSLLVS
jgi:hypothetical protein